MNLHPIELLSYSTKGSFMISLQKRQDKLKKHLQKQGLKLSSLQQKRLILGLSVFALLVASQILKGFFLEFIALFIALPIFLFFFKKSRRHQDFIDQLKKLSRFYKHQQKLHKGESFFGEITAETINPDLVRDLDLQELSVALDFSFSKEGKKLFNSWIGQKFSNSSFEDRHAQIKELSKFPGLLRRVHSNKPKKLVSFEIIQKEINRSFLDHNPLWKWLIPISWIALILCLFIGVPSIFWKTSLFIYLASSLFYFSISKDIFSRLQDLLSELEKLKPQFSPLSRLAQNLSFTPQLKSLSPQKNTTELTRLVSLMSIKSNPILFYILNAIVPWNFILTERCERSRLKISKSFNLWSQELIQIEAVSSFSNLYTYHQTVWPLKSEHNHLKVKNISHPLINQSTVVKNTFSQEDGKSIFIITGSNMSGKSTFLRAIGINFCLAKIGAPVFAESFEFPDYDIVSCIRVSDSLRDGQSYFYAEVRRMKTILESAKERPILFLIDEPLRGTNNRERLLGNQSYLEQILETNSIGFASTHDLELTQLADISPRVDNYHFTEDWKEKDLYFNYLIQDGPSKSTNALKILEKEGLYNGLS